MKTIIFAIAIFLSFQYMKYQVEEGKRSLKGFIEYLKEKFYSDTRR